MNEDCWAKRYNKWAPRDREKVRVMNFTERSGGLELPGTKMVKNCNLH